MVPREAVTSVMVSCNRQLTSVTTGVSFRTVSYRPPSNPPETKWAKHLDAVMRDRGWSRVRLFEEVGADLGYSDKSRSAFLKFLEDREPDANQQAVLRRHFGEPPELPDMVSPPGDAHTGGLAPLIELLAAQTAAITSLVAEIREERQERLRVRQEFADAVTHNDERIEDLNKAVGELTLRLQRAEARAGGRAVDPVPAVPGTRL